MPRHRQRRRRHLHRLQRDPVAEQRLVDQLGHRFRARAEQVETVGLEPVRMAARVDVPVDHAELRVVRRRGLDVVVHVEVRVVRRAQRQPPHVLHAVVLERGERILDVLRVLILEVVVTDGHDHVRTELGAHRLRELDDVRRADVAVRAALLVDAPARRDLEVEIDALPQDRDRPVVARNRVGHRVADERHVLRLARSAVSDRRAGRQHECRRYEDPPHPRRW